MHTKGLSKLQQLQDLSFVATPSKATLSHRSPASAEISRKPDGIYDTDNGSAMYYSHTGLTRVKMYFEPFYQLRLFYTTPRQSTNLSPISIMCRDFFFTPHVHRLHLLPTRPSLERVPAFLHPALSVQRRKTDDLPSPQLQCEDLYLHSPIRRHIPLLTYKDNVPEELLLTYPLHYCDMSNKIRVGAKLFAATPFPYPNHTCNIPHTTARGQTLCIRCVILSKLRINSFNWIHQRMRSRGELLYVR
jgi:hypothetical protein